MFRNLWELISTFYRMPQTMEFSKCLYSFINFVKGPQTKKSHKILQSLSALIKFLILIKRIKSRTAKYKLFLKLVMDNHLKGNSAIERQILYRNIKLQPLEKTALGAKTNRFCLQLQIVS
jgi:hypothetical protein